MKKVLFLDRDGTILIEPQNEQVDSFAKLTFLPGAITNLSRIAKETDYELVLVTNQDGLGTELFPEETFWPVQNKMIEILSGEGVTFSEIFIDRTMPSQNAPTRKPGTAMLTRYLAQGVDLESSFVIGDRKTDIQLARNLGCKAIFIGSRDSGEADAALTTDDWNEIYSYLKHIPRTATVRRRTNETDVAVSVNLDGTGKSTIHTGIGFLDHMLDQIPRHGNIDLEINVKGDLVVDEHHSAEDMAIALGEAILKALGKKKGIERYSFVLPMDDSLARVALDFGGRPWLVWDVNLRREKIGDMPTEMLFHFFKSFTDSAKCNLNVRVDGSNDHHMAESLFKAFAKALGQAVKMSGNSGIPSTKGIL